DGEDDAAVAVPGEVEHDGSLAVVDIEERPGPVLAAAAALGRAEGQERVADPEVEPPGWVGKADRDGGDRRVRDSHLAGQEQRAGGAGVADDERLVGEIDPPAHADMVRRGHLLHSRYPRKGGGPAV